MRQGPRGRVQALDRPGQQTDPVDRHGRAAKELDTVARHGADAFEHGLRPASALTRTEVPSLASKPRNRAWQAGHHEGSASGGLRHRPVDPAGSASGDVEAHADADSDGSAGHTDQGHQQGSVVQGER